MPAWGFGYLIFCGVLARGDWFVLIEGLPHLWLWRILFVVTGLTLYRASARLTATKLRWTISISDESHPFRVRRLVQLSPLPWSSPSFTSPSLAPAASSFLSSAGALR